MRHVCTVCNDWCEDHVPRKVTMVVHRDFWRGFFTGALTVALPIVTFWLAAVAGGSR